MIVQAAGCSQPVVQAEQYVGVVDPQRSARPHRQGGVDRGAPRDEWRYAVGRVVVDPGSKTIIQLKRDWPVEAGLEFNFGSVANILLV